MQRLLLVISICHIIIIIHSCIAGSMDNHFKEKTYNMQINSGKVLRKVETGHGDFLLIYQEGNIVDTVPMNSKNSYFDKIDSQITISKKEKSYDLEFRNLKGEKSRYNETVQLIYW